MLNATQRAKLQVAIKRIYGPKAGNLISDKMKEKGNACDFTRVSKFFAGKEPNKETAFVECIQELIEDSKEKINKQKDFIDSL